MRHLIPFRKPRPHVAVIRLAGVIAASGSPGRALSDVVLAPVIERAFRKGKPSAVALVINSPGGSPAQSSLIASRIRRLADEKDVKVYAFVEDVAASGGYYLATAADEIWVDVHSVVGSIGVISAGFGFHEFIARHGIERRVHTAGESKSLLDPFQPEKPEDLVRLKDLQETIHAGFIDHVKTRRGAKLLDEADLFTGNIWVGEKGIEPGLVDGVGHLVPKMKEVFGDKVRFSMHGPRRGMLSRFGARIIGDVVGSVEERALWARYGL
ncbi:multidrug transporter [Actibacterium mucosum KCTC 23349]|uniref:Multidrug transporter n=1 Tax=Actibacterium mucosum KCTC 23349 TaxID=1454373 RepID=A0A037ZC49_9RHOB|nr:multidrug transporter [Actibacterium mucosum KCTC 23349]